MQTLTLPGRIALSILIFFLLSAGHLARAAERWTSLNHVSFKHQLDPAFAGGYALAQDRVGFVWLGTQTGLVRWDGSKMRRFTASAGIAGALPDNYIHALATDTQGELWVGTSSGGVARFDAATETFTVISAGKNTLNDSRIAALASDGRGGMWVGSGGGLERILASGAVRNAESGAPQVSARLLPKGGIDALLHDSKGRLWVGTRRGLMMRTGDDAPLVSIPVAPRSEPSITSMYEDSSGRIWLATRAHGAFYIAGNGGPPVAINDTKDERVFSVVEKGKDILWLGTEGGGIVELDMKSGSVHRIRHQADILDSLQDDHVVALFKERGGQIFVATVEALSQHDPRTRGVSTIKSVGMPGKLSVPNLIARSDGTVWISNGGSAIAVLDPVKGKVAEFAQGPGSLPKARILSMANGPDGMVYIGTQQGLYVTAGAGQAVKRVELGSRDPKSPVWAMAVRGDSLWLGGHDGLWKLRIGANGPPELLMRVEEALGDQRVTAILPLADGSAWVGTRSGVVRITATGQVDKIASNTADRSQAPRGYIAFLMLDLQSRLWVATFSSGIAVMTGRDAAGQPIFRRIDTANGLPDNGINALLQDKRGHVWASCDTGLARIDSNSFEVESYGSNSGLNVPGYWKDAAAILPDDEIILGGTTGITILHPSAIAKYRAPSSIALTAATLGDRQVAVGQFNRNDPAAIIVSPENQARGFSVEFASMDFRPADQTRSSYRLEGFDPVWVDADAAGRRLSYTNLAPGSYRLHMRVEDGREIVAIKTIDVQVLPAWFQQSWFRIVVSVAVGALFLSLMQARTAMLRRRQRELETMVEARTADLTAMQEQLRTLAYADPLTGLPNRRLFTDELTRMASQARRDGHHFGLLLIDLDHFKAINDTLGHDAGDALLVTAAERIRQAVRDTDIVARLGGDEFAVLLAAGTEAASVNHVCSRIVASLVDPIVFQGNEMRIGASIGAAIIDKDHCSVEQAYKDADLALYQAKEHGRNQWFFDGASGRI
jgi:diguanylate cyclase (GGDEF)-like protein